MWDTIAVFVIIALAVGYLVKRQMSGSSCGCGGGGGCGSKGGNSDSLKNASHSCCSGNDCGCK